MFEQTVCEIMGIEDKASLFDIHDNSSRINHHQINSL